MICRLLFCEEQLYSSASADFLSLLRKYTRVVEIFPLDQLSTEVALLQSMAELNR